ncbi:hypothetical protein EBZ37_02845 [bacterium]|nr:hypothetical protein [bacterium]
MLVFKEIMNRLLLGWVGALGLYLTTHLLFFGTSPGLHYDEAWAANFSLKIAQIPGFWPIQAMSPQTHAWHHYLVAGVFRVFGASVETFRLTHIFMGLGGVVLLGKALARRLTNPALAPALVFLAGIQPSLVTNHRFAIELTSFHALCFGGMVFFALHPKKWAPFVAALIAAIGVSSHVFFIAPALALVLTTWFMPSAPSLRSRLAISLGIALCLPGILELQETLPEKDKAQALLFLVSFAFAATWAIAALPFWHRIRSLSAFLIRVLSVFTLPLLFFLIEGNWGILAHSGTLRFSALAGVGLIPILLAFKVYRKAPSELVLFWCCLALLTVAVAPKPTGRYWETLFLSTLVIFTGAWLSSSWKARVLVGFWPVILVMNLLIPASQGHFIDREYRFLLFHDRSTDFLPKQEATRVLLKDGCRFEQILGSDDRVKESLQFILSPNASSTSCQGRSFRATKELNGLRIQE